MPTKFKQKLPISLFFFAHQDDEFGVFQHIYLARAAGHKVFCVYLTTGVPMGCSTSVRDKESLKVLSYFGIPSEDIFFAGATLGISDGHLVRHLNRATDWIVQWINSLDAVDDIFIPAWEGGHPDHDLLHAAVLIAIRETKIQVPLHQFSLYNGYKCRGLCFRVFKPIPENGAVKSVSISWRNRLRFSRYCLGWPSQFKSWIGLLPFTWFHYIYCGLEYIQGVNILRLIIRPHDGALYYERRRFCTWPEVFDAVEECLQRKSNLIKNENK